MRSARHLLALALALLAAAGLSSCVVPLASADQNCTSYCGLLQGCGSAGAPQGDCSAWCNAFADEVKHVGCKTEFDDATACAVGEGTCDAATCGTQFATFQACTQTFCTKNPMDSACPSGG